MKRLMTCMLAVLCVAVWTASGNAVLSVVDMNTPDMTARTLAQTIMPGVVTLNETFTGNISAAGTFGGGLASGLGIDTGVILSTGLVTDAQFLNEDIQLLSNLFNLPGDADLAGQFPAGLCSQSPDDCITSDAAVLEFDFVPAGNSVTFRYVLASEEFCDPAFCAPANDIVGIFLNGVNIALLPGTASPVTVVRDFNFPFGPATFNAFIDNFTQVPAPFAHPYDGFTAVLTATATVTPGVQHHVKISIADAFDESIDSAVLVAAPLPPPPPCVPTLVDKYYTDILARPADTAGAAGWVSEVNRVTGLGMGTKEGLLAVSKFFFNSAEYGLRARTDPQYVADLYQTFFSRAPDAAGAAFWEAQLAGGLTRNMLLLSFANSAEFGLFLQNTCGTAATRPETDFVNDYYRGFLNRLPDTAGLNGWVTQMKAAQCSATPEAAVSAVSQLIATQFAPDGAEYVARARTNDQYVEDLYDSILRRSADSASFTVWVGQLTAGTPRINLLNTFLTAPEFVTRVNSVAAAGCAP